MTMTHPQMVQELRAHGYKIKIPPDMRVAGPWQPAGNRSWERTWEGSTASACYIFREHCAKRCNCDCDHGYSWAAKLLDGRKYSPYRRDGRANGLVEAQRQSDAALLEVLESYREVRLGNIHAEPYCPRDTLSLPETS